MLVLPLGGCVACDDDEEPAAAFVRLLLLPLEKHRW
jgi:hypothetical protein